MDLPETPSHGNGSPPPGGMPLTRNPVLAPHPRTLARYNARVLDPGAAAQVSGQSRLLPTVYVADRLIVSGLAEDALRDELTAVAADKGLRLVPPLGHVERRDQLVAAARAAGREDADSLFTTLHQLRPIEGSAVVPDSWDVLQGFRASIGADTASHQHVGLDHLMMAATGPLIGGSPFVMGHGIGGSPFVMGHGVGAPFVMGHGEACTEFAVAGWGGRQPVRWIGQPPARGDYGDRRRPVVAVLDTGVGTHPWLTHESVRLEETVLTVPVRNPEITGVSDPYEGLIDSDAGHGTFIAGLIRQTCPDADVLAIPIMGGDGVVPESDLLQVLSLLIARQHAAIVQNDASAFIDVLSLSLGYYHEQPADLTYDSQLLASLSTLGSMGVTVVVAAGNDSTDRPMYPAAFAPWPGGPVVGPDPDRLPVVSVGALNPNGTVALFSNAGDWVKCHRPGAAVVSTYPTTINGSGMPTFEVAGGPAGIRATIDPDSFAGGFAVWSGTSFAGPVLAGEIAAQLCGADLSKLDPSSSVTRGWAALTACEPGLHP